MRQTAGHARSAQDLDHRTPESPTRPQGQPVQNPSKVIASYPDYADAQRAVDALADQRFPVGPRRPPSS